MKPEHTKPAWCVKHTNYDTYAEVLTFGDKPQRVVQSGLTFDQAKRLCDELGFGYSIHPEAR